MSHQEPAAEIAALIAALGGTRAAGRALTALGVEGGSFDSLRRYMSGARAPYPGVLTALRQLASSTPRWLLAQDEMGRTWLIHAHEPGFVSQVEAGDLSVTRWLSPRPMARQEGILLAQAREWLATRQPLPSRR